MRMFNSKDATRAVGVTEQMTAEKITCFAQAGPSAIITGSADGLVSMWKVDLVKKELAFKHVLRGHTGCKLTLLALREFGSKIEAIFFCPVIMQRSVAWRLRPHGASLLAAPLTAQPSCK